MPRKNNQLSKINKAPGEAPAQGASSRAVTAPPNAGDRSKVLRFRLPGDGDAPDPTDPVPHHGPRLIEGGVMECVAIDMAHRWWDHETSIVTIRRKLNVSIPEAERIVRRGMRAREQRRKAA